MNAKFIVGFLIGTLFGWVILYLIASVFGIAIASLFSMVWIIVPVALVVLCIWLIYRIVVGNVWYSKDKNKKE